MKRSAVNRLIEEALDIFHAHGWNLPPFAHFTPEDWGRKGHDYDEIRENMLGWDITDFGLGNYDDYGLLLFTLRNGNFKGGPNGKPYAEKLMLVKENQKTPFHFHWSKMEDIINRGGGNLLIQVYGSTEDEQLSNDPVELMVDGRKLSVKAGYVLKLAPGESITIQPGLYHQFWAEAGQGPVVVGEVSKVNDDTADNRFLMKCGRFPAIEEDEPAKRLLVTEYPVC